MTTLDDFTRAYIDCALFTEQLETDYSADDIAPESLAEIIADCARFQSENAADIAAIPDWTGPADSFGRSSYSSDECAGHDFWYTRNGHGVGFWAREELPNELGRRLSDAAEAFGESYIYVGDDGKVYVS